MEPACLCSFAVPRLGHLAQGHQLAYASAASQMGVIGSLLGGNQPDCGCNRRKRFSTRRVVLEDARRVLLSNTPSRSCIQPRSLNHRISAIDFTQKISTTESWHTGTSAVWRRPSFRSLASTGCNRCKTIVGSILCFAMCVKVAS